MQARGNLQELLRYLLLTCPKPKQKLHSFYWRGALRTSRKGAGGGPAHSAPPAYWYVPFPAVELAAARAPSGGGGAASWRAPAAPGHAPARRGLGGQAQSGGGARRDSAPPPPREPGCAARRGARRAGTRAPAPPPPGAWRPLGSLSPPPQPPARDDLGRLWEPAAARDLGAPPARREVRGGPVAGSGDGRSRRAATAGPEARGRGARAEMGGGRWAAPWRRAECQ